MLHTRAVVLAVHACAVTLCAVPAFCSVFILLGLASGPLGTMSSPAPNLWLALSCPGLTESGRAWAGLYDPYAVCCGGHTVLVYFFFLRSPFPIWLSLPSSSSPRVASLLRPCPHPCATLHVGGLLIVDPAWAPFLPNATHANRGGSWIKIDL